MSNPVTNVSITVSYFIQDIAGALVSFDRMRWYRSRTGSDGLFEPATSATAQPPVLDGTDPEPHSINGKVLKLLINGVTEVSITFSGGDPYDTATVVTEINAANAVLNASANADGTVRLSTTENGSGASIEIVEGSDAAPYLGFEVGSGAIGLDADTTLVSGTHEYFYTDEQSNTEFWYKIELYHSVTNDRSPLSVAFPADQVLAVPATETIVGFIKLASMTGRPDVGRVITFYNPPLPNKSNSGSYGVMKSYEQVTTDSAGYAEVRLLRGITVDMAIEGTGLVRRITVPTTGDAFDLLDPSLVSDDEFEIHVPDLDFAMRTS